MNEPAAVEHYIRARLVASPDLAALVGDRVYSHRVPPRTGAYPAVVFRYYTGQDRTAAGGDERVFARPEYLVYATVKGGDWTAADAAAAVVDRLLSRAHAEVVTVDGQAYEVVCAGRREPYRRDLMEADTEYRHAGGFYRFFVQSV